MSFKKLFIALIAVVAAISLVAVQETFAAQIQQEYLFDNFDNGVSSDTWQIVNDTDDSIGLQEQTGNLRYNVSGAEEAIVTKDPLTRGTGVTGYSVQFDFNYLSDNWEDFYAFAFNKTSVTKGLDWGNSGYLLGRTGSLQVNNPADSSSTGQGVDAFAALTPDIPNVPFRNITFKFVYNKTAKTVDMYYDLVGDTQDLTTVRATYTFGGLSDSGDYHFAIITSGLGFVNIDNMIIKQLTADGEIDYVDADFETNTLPEEIVLVSSDFYSYGPAKSLKISDSSITSRIVTKDKYVADSNVFEPLTVDFDLQALNMTDQNKFGFVYGLNAATDDAYKAGVTYLFFRNVVSGATTTTYLAASVADGTTLVNKADKDLGVNLLDVDDFINVKLVFNVYGKTIVYINDEQVLTYTGSDMIGHFGFFGEADNEFLIDNVLAVSKVYDDQAYSRTLKNNFNTGYVDPADFEIFNYIDKKPGSEVPLFQSTKGIHVADGKLHFDVASESSALYTITEFNDFEMRFEISNFNVPRTAVNEDGEIDSVEIPDTFYVAVGMGYKSNVENFWNVRGIYFQDRFGNATIETMNINAPSSGALSPKLRMSTEENAGETFHFKIVAKEGTVSYWVRRGSDPVSIFDGEPIAVYHNVDTKGRIGISTSALGSFSLDNLSIVPIGANLSTPIEDQLPPADLVAPTITVNATLPKVFDLNTTAVDFKTYFSVTDNKDGNIIITDQMLNLGGFDLTKVGAYTVELTVSDSDGNESKESFVVAVSRPEVVEETPVTPETPKAESNTVMVAIITSVVSIIVAAGTTFIFVTKFKK